MADYIKNPVDIYSKRSAFPIHERHQTTMPFGKLIPLYCEEVIAGDTWKCDLRNVIRIVSPFVNATFGDLFFDAFAFYVPMRLVWEHTKQFFGENDSGAWTQTNTYLIPTAKVDAPGDRFTLGDYFGLPVGSSPASSLTVNELPLRAYWMIWNTYFRDENFQSPKVFSLGDASNSSIGYSSVPASVARYHDYFSSVLPAPQKGNSVNIINGLGSFLPLDTTPAVHSFTDSPSFQTASNLVGSGYNFFGLNHSANSSVGNVVVDNSMAGTASSATLVTGSNLGVRVNMPSLDVNDLRYSVVVQRYLEKLARGGSRYAERIRAIYGVSVDDTTAQIPVRLGGYHCRISYSQIYQSSSTDDSSPQGHPVLYGMSNGEGNIISRSFVEPGYVIVLGCIRQKHVYSQMLRRMWTKRDVLELWNPGFSFLGEQKVYSYEIYGVNGGSPSVFGYLPYGQEYRDFPDFVTGGLRPDVGSRGLPTFTMADTYSSAPTAVGILDESSSVDNVTRALALKDNDNLFACDFNLDGVVVRPMPVYGIPGLLDHF